MNRYIATTWALIAALLVSAPALLGAVHGRVDPSTAVSRLLVALVLCTAGAWLFSSMLRGYHDTNLRMRQRRRDDRPAG
jgi:hypothetical protein